MYNSKIECSPIAISLGTCAHDDPSCVPIVIGEIHHTSVPNSRVTIHLCKLVFLMFLIK